MLLLPYRQELEHPTAIDAPNPIAGQVLPASRTLAQLPIAFVESGRRIGVSECVYLSPFMRQHHHIFPLILILPGIDL